jgi:hypothetical protein
MFSHRGRPRIASPTKVTLRAIAGECHTLGLSVFEHHRGTVLLADALERWQSLVCTQYTLEQQKLVAALPTLNVAAPPPNDGTIAGGTLQESQDTQRDPSPIVAQPDDTGTQKPPKLKRHEPKKRGDFSSVILKHCSQLLSMAEVYQNDPNLTEDKLMDSWTPLLLQFIELLSTLSESTVLPEETKKVIGATKRVIAAAAIRETTLNAPSAKIVYTQWSQGLKQALKTEESKILEQQKLHASILHRNNFKVLEIHRRQAELRASEQVIKARKGDIELLKKKLDSWHDEMAIMHANQEKVTQEKDAIQTELHSTNWRWANMRRRIGKRGEGERGRGILTR